MLAGALSLFAPAHAEAQTTIWTSTLTVDRYALGSNVWHGCSTDSSNYDDCTTALSDRHISVPGAGTYEIRVVVIYTVSGNTALTLRTKPTSGASQDELPASFDASIFLTVDGSSSFAFNDAVRTTGNAGVVTHRWDSPGIQWSDNQQVSVKLTVSPPQRPRNLRVGEGYTHLGLTWTAPSGLVEAYDVHYTSVLHRGVLPDTAPALNHPLRNSPAAGWVALSRGDTAASHTISSLSSSTAYRVRVRARNSAGASDWVFGTGTTSAPVFTLAPASGDVLVSNFSQSRDNLPTLVHVQARGQAFTTGSVPTILSSIDLVGGVSANLDQLQAELWSATAGGIPNAKISDLAVPSGNIAAGATVSLRAPANTRLAANTAYSLVVYRPGSDSIGFVAATSHNEDPGGATGWSIADGSARGNGTSPSAGFENSLVSTSLFIAVRGSPVPPPTVSLSATPNPVREGSPVTVTATLSVPLSEDVRIPIATASVAKEIRIPAGATTGTYVHTAGDAPAGGTKREQMVVENRLLKQMRPAIKLGDPYLVNVQVLDGNADLPRVSVSDAKGWEQLRYGRLCFEFTLNRAASHEIWVGYRTENGTAIAGQDYQGVVGSPVIPFAPGETRKRKCISIWDDNVEDSGETFSMVLVNPHGALLGRDRGTGTIYNHESTSLSALIVEGASAEDGPFTALDMGAFAPGTTAYGVTVPHGTTHVRLRPKASNSNLTITTGLDGKGKSPVSSGQAGPAVALAVGENVLVVKTEFNGQRQTYRVTVTRQAAAAVAVSLSATPNPVGEGSPVTVRATLTAALLGDVTIPLSTRRDTSEEGDHGSLSAITVPAGFTSATGTLPTFEDSDGEDETFTLSLGSLPTGLTAGSASSVQVTITKQQSSGATTTDTSTTTSSSDTTTSSSGVSTTASGPDGETLLVGFGQIAQTPPEVSIALDGAAPISEGEAARFRVSRTGSTTAPLNVNLVVRENQAEGQDFVAAGNEGNKTLTIPAGQDSALYTVPTDNDDMDEANGSITATVTPGTGYTVSDNTAEAEVTVQDNDAPVAAPPTEEKRAWHVRFGRSVSQQVVDALQQRFSSTTTPSGLQLTLAGETLTSDTPLEENHVLLSRLLGFESVSSQEVAQGSSFSFSPEGAGARLSFWGQGALSSFNGVEESITLTGEVTTAVVGAEWRSERWRAGAALSHSWGSGSYQGEGDGGDGRISSSSLTGIFPYGRYALTPRLGIWATAGYGWGNLTLNPDGDGPEYNPATTMALGAVGMDGLLLDGGSDGVSLTTTADVLLLKTSSEAVVGLASSEGEVSRFRLGLEASRAFPLANGASLSPSLEVGLRQDSGDAETGFGMDLGAGLSWSDPEQGITAAVKGRTLLSHGAEDFQDQGLALSFSWQPSPSNRGASLSLSHAVGLPAEGGLAALLNPTAIEVLDEPNSDGERFEARLAYGFPFYNDRLTLTPSVALALSSSSRSYGLLWSLAPHDEHLVGEPWQLSLEGELREDLSSSPTVDHSLKLRFALPL